MPVKETEPQIAQLVSIRTDSKWDLGLELSFEGLGMVEGPMVSSPNIFLSLQIGSYFGGELCGIDMDQDGETELLLIGAPLFYGEQRGGRVFIYQKKQVGTRS